MTQLASELVAIRQTEKKKREKFPARTIIVDLSLEIANPTCFPPTDLDENSCPLTMVSFGSGPYTTKSQKYQELLANSNNNNCASQLNYNLLSAIQNGKSSLYGAQPLAPSKSCTMDTTSSISSMSDIEIDETHIKEEPLSPHSSGAASPHSHLNYHSSGIYYGTGVDTSTTNSKGAISLVTNLSAAGAFGQNELVYSHKVSAGD